MTSPATKTSRTAPSIVVVDPRFDAYKALATSARLGKLTLHFRASGAEAAKLARRLDVDGWFIAADLEDMSGLDLVPLVRSQVAAAGKSHGKVAVVDEAACHDPRAAGADATFTSPITFADVEHLLGLPTAAPAAAGAEGAATKSFVDVAAIVSAAMITMGVLLIS